MKKCFSIIAILVASFSAEPLCAQIVPEAYLPQLHSHNDYTRNHPFALAYGLGFGSIEVDLFLQDGELYVAHEQQEVSQDRTFDKLYLQPILEAFKNSKDGYLYPDQGQLQLLIDPKTDGGAVLDVLTRKLKPYRQLFDATNNDKAVKLVVSGKKPKAEDFDKYDKIFFFDGDLGVDYSPQQLARVGLFSTSFSDISEWNGLGRLTGKDLRRVQSLVDSVHALKKPIRFWASPDTKTTWYEWLKMNIDYINTDQPHEAAEFVRKYKRNAHLEDNHYQTYKPKSGQITGKPKNVILLISDGAGLSQLWAAALANRGELNVLNMPFTGYLFTGSTDNYHTDSAAGGSALATGVKTRNRYIGVDTLGRPVTNIPDYIAKYGLVSGIVSNDKITGATPSAFYAHVSERDSTSWIASQLLDSKLSLMVGGFHPVFADRDSLFIKQLRKQGMEIRQGISQFSDSKSDRLLVFAEDHADRAWDKLQQNQDEIKTDDRLIEDVFETSVRFLENRSNADKGFFLMLEGAKIDGGGHSNSMPFTVSEYLSFDRMVGQALAYADQNKETLVIVTSDHETGGLVLLDGDKRKGHVLGQFATTDHTGIPVPLMAFGPGAEHFQGFVDNSEIARRIYKVLGVDLD